MITENVEMPASPARLGPAAGITGHGCDLTDRHWEGRASPRTITEATSPGITQTATPAGPAPVRVVSVIGCWPLLVSPPGGPGRWRWSRAANLDRSRRGNLARHAPLAQLAEQRT